MGKDGTLPWPKDREDLTWFKSNTIGDIVVMGKNTWLDPMMPKPLPGRLNVVVANTELHSCDAAHLVLTGKNLESDIRRLADENKNKTVWIIGGATLLKSTASLADEIYLTKFDGVYGCDVKIDIDDILNGYRMIRGTPANGKVFLVYEKLS